MSAAGEAFKGLCRWKFLGGTPGRAAEVLLPSLPSSRRGHNLTSLFSQSLLLVPSLSESCVREAGKSHPGHQDRCQDHPREPKAEMSPDLDEGLQEEPVGRTESTTAMFTSQ